MRILLFILIGLFGVSCSPYEEPNQEEYFYQIDSFETPKVYVYEYTVGVNSEKQYFRLEKISDTTLNVKIYSENSGLTSEIIDWYKPNGIELIKSNNYGTVGNLITSEITAGQLFLFESESIGHLHLTHYDSMEHITIEDQTDWKIDRFEHSFDEHIMYTSGTVKQKITPDEGPYQSFEFPVEIEYTAGTGLTKMVFHNNVEITTISYLETISPEQFEKLQLSH